MIAVVDIHRKQIYKWYTKYRENGKGIWCAWLRPKPDVGGSPYCTAKPTRPCPHAYHGFPPAVGRWCPVIEGDVDGGLLVGVSRPMLRTQAIQRRAPRSACIAPEPSPGAL